MLVVEEVAVVLVVVEPPPLPLPDQPAPTDTCTEATSESTAGLAPPGVPGRFVYFIHRNPVNPAPYFWLPRREPVLL